MSFIIDKITIYYDKITPPLKRMFTGTVPPDASDRIAHEALEPHAAPEPHHHDVEPLHMTIAETLKTAIMTTGLATAAVLGGWQIALGGYLIYSGVRWVSRNRRKGDGGPQSEALEPVEDRSHVEEDAPNRQVAEIHDAEANLQEQRDEHVREHMGPAAPKSAPASFAAFAANSPSVEAVNGKSGEKQPEALVVPNLDVPDRAAKAEKKKEAAEPAPAQHAAPKHKPKIDPAHRARQHDSGPGEITFFGTLVNAWKNNHYAHGITFKMIACAIFFPLNWIFQKVFRMTITDAPRRAVPIAKVISTILTGLLIFPWFISISQYFLARKK